MTDKTGDSPSCLNCGAPLIGQYCGQCGQRATSRFISLWELIRDAFGDMFELDSRLWRTVVPLLIRPGQLTRDYLEGRRARYMPPFRMYLVLSLIFFVVAFFNPRNELAILFEPPSAEEIAAETEAEAQKKEQAAEEIQEDLDEARAQLEELAEQGVIDPAVIEETIPDSGSINVTVDGDELDMTCDDADLGDMPDFLKRRLTPERVLRACEHWKSVGGDGLASAVIDNVPAALIILLPLMALVLKLLYPLSRRYYVEHLLFFVHFHAFFFLLLTLQILWVRGISSTPLHDAVAIVPSVAAGFYIPVYLYKSMRRVYTQGGLFTFLKFLFLTTTYVIGFALVMLGALLIAAFSV